MIGWVEFKEIFFVVVLEPVEPQFTVTVNNIALAFDADKGVKVNYYHNHLQFEINLQAILTKKLHFKFIIY